MFNILSFYFFSGNSRKVFGLDQDDLRNDSAKESIEFAGDDDNRNPYRVDDVDDRRGGKIRKVKTR